MPETQDIIVEVKPGGVGLIRLNRPEALNALRSTLMEELAVALDKFDQDPSIGAIVITGNEKAFAAGADIKEFSNETAISIYQKQLIEKWDHIRKIRKPIIAAVSGHCLGGGNELAMACDMIIASDTARFGQPEIKIGVIPGAGGTQRLTLAVGKAIAMEMILNGRLLNAEEALRFGLINRVVPVASYLEEAIKCATEIAARAPVAVQFAKEAISKAFEEGLTAGLAHERKLFYYLFATEDQKEGMKSFVEKRAAKWQGK